MRKWLGVVVFGLVLSGCMGANVRSNIDNRDSLIDALNTQQDGFAGVMTETGEHFTIQSTSASSHRLCRVVSIESGDRYIVESFCKAKGGAWR